MLPKGQGMESGIVQMRLRGASISRNGQTIIEKMNLDLVQGECIVLLGGNGSGKSSIIEAIVGLIGFNSEATCNFAVKRHRIGLCLQADGHVGDLTVGERIDEAASLLEYTLDSSKREKILQRWGLAHRQHDRIGKLSGGLKRRLAVAVSLLIIETNSPSIILLDEPERGLDAKGIVILEETLGEAKKMGHAILLATHEKSLTHLADQVLNLDDTPNINCKSDDGIEVVKFSRPKFRTGPRLSWMLRLEGRTGRSTMNRGILGLLALALASGLVDMQNDERIRAAAIMLPCVLIALSRTSALGWLSEDRAGDWWRALTSTSFIAHRVCLLSVAEAIFWTIPVALIACVTIANVPSTPLILITVLWNVICLSFFSASLGLLLNQLSRSIAAASMLLAIVIALPVLLMIDEIAGIISSEAVVLLGVAGLMAFAAALAARLLDPLSSTT